MKTKFAKQPRPFANFVFSWEALHPDKESRAFCYDELCPCCGTQPIEIYADHIVLATDGNAMRELTTRQKTLFIVSRIDELVLHELAHWAGCGEDEAQNVALVAWQD